ncbi:VWA domain-containing protein [Massilia sp. METH4]|uniref:TadE/TadG family type IV pilus assembly protein n=1 Tax=Massilia sp. METH4 TaxID=3123041 RepID=UPI0030CCEF65
MTHKLSRQRGAVAIMVALAMLVLLAVAGLVIDGGLAYLVKARLNAAVDAAAVAAARAVPAGNTQIEQIASAQAASAQFFAANIPASYLLSKPKLLSTKVTFNGGEVKIDVTAEAPMQLSFMRVMGFTSLTPQAYAQTVRKDLDMVLVVDNSGSLYDYRATVKASAKWFLNKFNKTQDRVGLVSFAAGARINRPISRDARGFDRAAMLSSIDAMVFSTGTTSVEGMWNARAEINAIPLLKRSAMRVIVFFSDGAPTGIGTYGALKSSALCPTAGSLDIQKGLRGLWSLGTTGTELGGGCDVDNNAPAKLAQWYNAHNIKDETALREFRLAGGGPRTVGEDIGTDTLLVKNVGAAAYNLAEAVAAKARDENIYVFTLGLGAGLKSASGYNNENNEAFLKCMANVADGPARCYDPAKPVGMYCYAATDADLTPCFSKLASAILRIAK